MPLPFGLNVQKPHHFRDMLGIAWKNRDNLNYAWKVLSQGACDGCALGVAGLHDWTIEGTHLCMTRLNLLRLNTMPAMDVSVLADVAKLRAMNNEQLRELGRLPYPMLREKAERGFTRISWRQAYERLARRIRGSSPDRLAFFLTSRGITNETYYVAQKVARFLGTNNVDNAARLCHSPSTGSMKSTIGVAATTCSYKDLWGTDLVVFFGANPANDQPVMMKYLDAAKKQGTKIAMVNPYAEPGMMKYWVPSDARSAVVGTQITDHFFQVAHGGDIAFIYGVLKILFENNWIDESFVGAHTTGIEQLRQASVPLQWHCLEESSGTSKQKMFEFAQLIAQAKTGILVWSMGITQHAFGGDAVQMILNLGLVKGFVGRDKCGLMPIRGHSGVQGGAEMGAYATVFPGGKAINRENAASLSKAYGFDVPDKPGLSAPEMIEASAEGKIDLLWSVGGNFLRTLPDPDYVAAAMAKVPMRVHQDIILTDQMLIDGEEVLLLPAKTRYEQDDGGTQTSTERRVMFSPEIPRQVEEAKAEWRIMLELAQAVDPERAKLIGCETGQAIREEIARIIPSYDGIQRLQKTGDAFQYGGPHLCANGNFPTPDGKAHFRPVNLPDLSRGAGEFFCSTRRGKQFNTLVYAEVDPLNGAPRDAVLINPDDAAKMHLHKGSRVKLTSRQGEMICTAQLAEISPGNVQVHWPEGNVLIAYDTLDPVGKVPDYNAYVKIERIDV